MIRAQGLGIKDSGLDLKVLWGLYVAFLSGHRGKRRGTCFPASLGAGSLVNTTYSC